MLNNLKDKNFKNIILFICLFIFNINLLALVTNREDLYIQNRKKSKNIGYQDPKIFLCCSGGGHRAMINALGAFSGLQETGLWDKILYVSTLSGSTWALDYLLANKINNKTEFDQAINKLKLNLNTNFFKTNPLYTLFVETKKKSVQEIWSELLSNQIFAENQEIIKQKFSEISPNPTIFPFPLFSATVKVNSCPCCCLSCCFYNNEWLEISPYHLAIDKFKSYVTTESFENIYKQTFGKTCYQDYFLAIFSCAYSISIKDIFRFVKEKALLNATKDSRLKEIKNSLKYGDICPILIPDFTSQDPDQNFLIARDAGFEVNLPIYPIISRLNPKDKNIIIICDATGDAENLKFSELKKARNFCKLNGLNFPNLNNPVVITEKNSRILIFSGNPTIIYVPNMVPVSTLKLSYKPEEFDALFNPMRETMIFLANKLASVL